MSFDYDGFITKLKEFQNDDIETAKRAEADGLTKIAKLYHRSARHTAKTIRKVKVMRDKST